MSVNQQVVDKERMASATALPSPSGSASEPAGFAAQMKKLIFSGALMDGIVVESIDTAGEGRDESVTIEFRVPQAIEETVDNAGVIHASSDGPLYTFTFSARHSPGANIRRLKAYFASRSKAVAQFGQRAARMAAAHAHL